MNKEKTFNLVLKYCEKYLYLPDGLSKRELKSLSLSRWTGKEILDILMNPFEEENDGIKIIEDFIFNEEILSLSDTTTMCWSIIDTAIDILNYVKKAKE